MSKVATDWHELIIPRHIMRSYVVCNSKQLDPLCSMQTYHSPNQPHKAFISQPFSQTQINIQSKLLRIGITLTRLPHLLTRLQKVLQHCCFLLTFITFAFTTSLHTHKWTTFHLFLTNILRNYIILPILSLYLPTKIVNTYVINNKLFTY